MPGGFSNFTENKVLEHIFPGPPWSPGAPRIGLCTANPTDVGTGAACFEVSNVDTNYARVLTAPDDWELSETTAGIVYNKNEIEFNSPSGDWGLIKYFAILNSSIYGQGDMLIYGLLDPEIEIVVGSIPRFSPHAMRILLE